MIIVIDDERTFKNHDGLYARNSNEGLALIAQTFTEFMMRNGECIDELWLDHDLGGDDTIMAVVDYLSTMASVTYHDDGQSQVFTGLFIQQIYVHSQNASGAELVCNALKKDFFCAPHPLPELV